MAPNHHPCREAQVEECPVNGIVLLIVGGLAMTLGLKGFSAQGLPLSKDKNIDTPR
jgi:hypothetical protein